MREARDRFVAATEPHRPELWEFCRRLTGSVWDGEDLAQETMLRAFARLANFWQPLRSPRAYLFRVATNTWIDWMHRAPAAVPVEAAPDTFPAAHRTDLAAESREALEILVRLLPPRQRVALVLADAFGFRAREIGAMLGATEGAVADIVGVAEEHGRDVIRAQSLAEGMASPIPQRAEVAEVDGQPVVCVFYEHADRPRALGWLIRLGMVEGRICRWTAYVFTPELVRDVAGRLGVPAEPAGYRYVAPVEGA